MNDVSDDKKFYKTVIGPLMLVRNAIGDGLFTVRLHCPRHAYRRPLTRVGAGTQRRAELGHCA